MRIALTHDHLFQIGGAEKVLLELTKIFPRSPIYTLITNPSWQAINDLKIITSYIQKMPFSRDHFKWYLPLMPIAWEKFNFSNYDLIISSASAFAKGIILTPKTLHICYCHSPTRYLWSDTHQYIDELNQPLLIKKLLPLILNYLRVWDFASAQRVDKFIANSKFVAKRIKKYYQRDATIIYPPVDVDKYKIDSDKQNYYVIVSRLRPYKRVDLAIKAFNQLGLSLKIIGGGEEEKNLRKIAKKNIEFLGEVSEQKKINVLSRALAFINPQEEDFGIAAVEGMASGLPVIAFKGGGAEETVIDNETGKFFPEQCWEALADTILRINLNDYDPLKIKSYANKFSPSVFHEKINNFVTKSYQEYKGNILNI